MTFLMSHSVRDTLFPVALICPRWSTLGALLSSPLLPTTGDSFVGRQLCFCNPQLVDLKIVITFAKGSSSSDLLNQRKAVHLLVSYAFTRATHYLVKFTSSLSSGLTLLGSGLVQVFNSVQIRMVRQRVCQPHARRGEYSPSLAFFPLAVTRSVILSRSSSNSIAQSLCPLAWLLSTFSSVSTPVPFALDSSRSVTSVPAIEHLKFPFLRLRVYLARSDLI